MNDVTHRSVVVRHGDCLSIIAERELGNYMRGMEIYLDNMAYIRDDPRNKACMRQFGGNPPDWIFPRQVLRIRAH